MKTKIGKFFRSIPTFIVLVIIVSFASGILFGFCYGMYSCYKFSNLYDRAVTVQAVVTYHDQSTDSDDDITYHSYITYTHDGVKYTTRYESSSSSKKLTAVGETVSVKINPDKPDQLMSEIALWGLFGAGVLGPVIFIFLVRLLRNRYRDRQKNLPIDRVDEETICRHLKTEIKCRMFSKGLLIISLWYFILYLAFPLMFSENALLISFAAGLWYLLCVNRARRDMSCVKKGRYLVLDAVLESKKESMDGEEADKLIYRLSDGQAWTRSATSGIFKNAQINDKVQVVVYVYKETKPHPAPTLCYYKVNDKLLLEFNR